MDQEVNGRLAFFKLPDHLSGLLANPGPVRMRGAARHINSSRAEFDKEQHIHRLQEKRVDRKDISRKALIFVMLHQLPPTG